MRETPLLPAKKALVELDYLPSPPRVLPSPHPYIRERFRIMTSLADSFFQTKPLNSKLKSSIL